MKHSCMKKCCVYTDDQVIPAKCPICQEPIDQEFDDTPVVAVPPEEALAERLDHIEDRLRTLEALNLP